MKYNPTTVGNIGGNPTSAAATINANLAAISVAIQNTLSRDGTLPNHMDADLDMNHNDVINAGVIYADDINVAGISILALLLSLGLINGNFQFATFRQVLEAMADNANPAGSNIVPVVKNIVDPLSADGGSAQFNASQPMRLGDDLSNLIETAMSWTDIQMKTFFNLARTKTP